MTGKKASEVSFPLLGVWGQPQKQRPSRGGVERRLCFCCCSKRGRKWEGDPAGGPGAQENRPRDPKTETTLT